jgi:hypothetical protein
MRASVNKGELALALVFAALGLLWIVRSARMPLWEGFAPDPADDIRKPLVVLAALIAAVAALPFAGFAVSIFALLLFLYARVERLPWFPATLVSAATTGALYLVFKTWLGVPLPSFVP